MQKRFLIYPFLVAFVLFLSLAPFSHAATYKWNDFTKPLKVNSTKIVLGTIVIVELNLPGFIKNYEELPLIINVDGGAVYNGTLISKTLTINDKIDYRFIVPFHKSVVEKVNIKTKFLKKGINKLQFKGSGNTGESGYTINQIRFDISALKNLQTYMAKTPKSNYVEKKEKKPSANKPKENRVSNRKIKRMALVIGNGAYKSAPLKNTVNDAEDMATILRNLDFNVMLKKDADQRTMQDSIRYFGKQLRQGGVGLFYFSGHGMQIDGRNYLIPIDVKIETESDVEYEAVDAGRVLGKMEDAGNKLNIVLLDACRNNPFARSFRTGYRGLARMDAPTGSLIAYSTAPGEVAADGIGRNGIFTKHLMIHMSTLDLPIEQVLKRVRIDVSNETFGRQIPWESSSLMGDFYFNPEKSTINTKKVGKSKIPSESASETQVAAISDDNERNIEPWTGIWDWKYYWGDGYKFVIKQNGNSVKSTNDSYFKFSGTIEGNTLQGWIEFDGRKGVFCSLKISSDYNSFMGSYNDLRLTPNSNFVYGKRKK